MSFIDKPLFHAFRVAMPLRRSLPARVIEKCGRRAYPHADKFFWFRNHWGHEFNLTYSYHIDRQIAVYGTYDPALHRAIECMVKPGMICMDAGANIGEMTLHMASRAQPGGLVYAFEPVPHEYNRLVAHIERNGLGYAAKPFDIALSNTKGPISIAFSPEDADNQALASIVNTSRKELTRRIEIQACTLDAFVEQHGITRIDFMKIDIQGGEWLLLEGGAQVFSTLSPDLLMEISPLDLQAIGRDSRQLMQMVEGFGYSVFTLQPNGTPGARLSASSIDPGFSASNVLCTKRAGNRA